MIFDQGDVELLRLMGWYKLLPAGIGRRYASRLFCSQELSLLEGMGLIYRTRNGRDYRLRPKGSGLLEGLGFACPQDKKYVSDAKTIRNRERAALVMTAFYRAGNSIFGDSPAGWTGFLSFAAMRRSRLLPSQAFPGLSLMGAARNGERIYGCCYVEEGGQLCLQNELRALGKLAADRGTGLFLCGECYGDILNRLKAPPAPARRNGALPYGALLRQGGPPVSLLECSDAGAAQLLLTGRKEYRKELARLALGGLEPSGSCLWADGVYRSRPAIVGVDMELPRLLTACQAAEGARPIIIAFKEQLPAIADYCSPYRPELLGGGWKEALSALGLGLYDPPQEAYLNAEGRCLDAALIQANRRMGKPAESEVL